MLDFKLPMLSASEATAASVLYSDKHVTLI